jgi:20S proteasome alpha/beta subunit
MNYININPLHPFYSELITEGINKGYTVVCSQRPLNGLKTWEYETIGNGRYYAYGSLKQFENVWSYLDAKIIKLTTNEDIERIISDYCNEEGIDINEILMDNTLSELAENFDLCYID